MNIHEYQAKQLFARYQIPIPNERVCVTVQEVKHAFLTINRPIVIKAQVHAGGRGKAGGVKIANTLQEAEENARQILGMTIKGLKVEKVLVSLAADITRETYVGLIADRSRKNIVLMASAKGGVEIEELAATVPEKIVKIEINPEIGLLDFQARNVAFHLFPDLALAAKATKILKQLYRCYVEADASLAEINPLAETPDGEILALDAKINLDDNALYRHQEFEAFRDLTDDEKKELDAKNKGLSYIKLDGDIGCIVNGAGLAMATMDVIQLYGGRPANFLDIGGSSSPQKVIDAMTILLSDRSVKVVMINIFGGITRCDDVANGLLTAMNQMEIAVPIVARLTGTNEQEGHEILQGNNRLLVAASMREAAQMAIHLLTQASQKAQ